jgi:hypothetical protein
MQFHVDRCEPNRSHPLTEIIRVDRVIRVSFVKVARGIAEYSVCGNKEPCGCRKLDPGVQPGTMHFTGIGCLLLEEGQLPG